MSSATKFSVLAFASTVLASAPAYGGHGYGHQHLHSSAPPYAYPQANTTISYGATGAPSYASTTCTESSSAPAYSQSAPSYSQSAPSYSQSAPSYSQPASSYSQGVPSYSQGNGEATTSTQYQTVYHTVSYAPTSSGASPAGYGSGGSDQCPQDVTVTHTEKVYVTVPAGQIPHSSYASSAPAYSAPSSSSAAYSPPAYSAPSSSAASSYSSPAYSAPEPSFTAVHKDIVTPAEVNTASSSGSSSGGKRGIPYNVTSMTTPFEGSTEITWAYNWLSSSDGLSSNFKFMPTLHDGSDTFTSVWNSEASAAIASGSTTVFSFNEPDQPTQANMSPGDAAAKHVQFMNPLAGKAKVCAPSVTNGQESTMGLNWLQDFLTACGKNCQIDCLNVHWYNTPSVSDFKGQIGKALEMADNLGVPLYVSEIGCNGGSDDEVNSFLQEVMPWMDSNDQIAGYAYFMAYEGLLLSGNAPSMYGTTYMSSA